MTSHHEVHLCRTVRHIIWGNAATEPQLPGSDPNTTTWNRASFSNDRRNGGERPASLDIVNAGSLPGLLLRPYPGHWHWPLVDFRPSMTGEMPSVGEKGRHSFAAVAVLPRYRECRQPAGAQAPASPLRAAGGLALVRLLSAFNDRRNWGRLLNIKNEGRLPQA